MVKSGMHAALFLMMFCSIALAQGGPGGGGTQGDGVWLRNAYFGEFQTFDRCFGHQPQSGTYHDHVQPILGWAFDGYPAWALAHHAGLNETYDDGKPAFPYIMGMQYYGSVNGGNAATVPTTAQDYFSNGRLAGSTTAPQVTSWYTAHSNDDARAGSGFDPSAGGQVTWPFAMPSRSAIERWRDERHKSRHTASALHRPSAFGSTAFR